jgi:histidine ammonia-lyase
MRGVTGAWEGPAVVVVRRVPVYGLTGAFGARSSYALPVPVVRAAGRGPGVPATRDPGSSPRLDDDRPSGVDVETVCRDILESDDVRSGPRALPGEASTMVGGAA